jgi:gamma-glutamylcyclotransferase (GGCT)/AIG2-like uncharacterized protein YtfP
VSLALFVYGTLRPGLPAAARAPHSRALCSHGLATLPGRLFDLGDYPGAVLDAAAATRVVGEIAHLDLRVATLDALDRYEGFDPLRPERCLFRRERWRASALAAGEPIECWVYVFAGDVAGRPEIEGGDFARFVRERSQESARS